MALVTESSPVIAIPDLDLFSKTPVQESVEATYCEQIRPIAQLNTGGHIEFVINNGIHEYIKLKETTLYVKFRVKLSRTDTAAVVASDWNKVSVVNNLLHSLWSQIDLSIGDSQTTTALQTYPYRAYFETILGSTEHGRKTYLQLSGFYEDDMVHKDNPQPTRQILINHKAGDPLDTGRVCEFEGKLHLDLFFQPRSLIGGTRLKLKLIPNRPEFYFMSSDDKIIPHIEFLDVHLNLFKFRVDDNLLKGHMSGHDNGPARYILNRSEVRSITIDKGASSRNVENVIYGQLPRRVYIAFIGNEAYSGSFKKNPYYFHHYFINSLACFVNGEQNPRKAYTPDFENDLFVREFTELYRISEQLDNDSRMLIDRNSFKNGYSIFAFNLSPDMTQGYNSVGYVSEPKDGVLRFEIHFARQLDTTINALIYCEFDNQLNIAQDRSAYMDYR